MKVSVEWLDHGAKCQSQIYLKSMLWLVTQTPLSFSPRVFIFGIMIAYGL